jgi:hypothetical protein
MKIYELEGGVLYIEEAFPLHKEFIEAIEDTNNINTIIPDWSDWMDGRPIDGVWTPTQHTGYFKMIDWDYTINEKNKSWPRKNIDFSYSKDHAQSYDILKMIDEPYQKALDVWCEKTRTNKLDWITKNYTIKKYKTDKAVGTHADRDHDFENNTFDWTALIYLNDNYEGGELFFDTLGYTVSPKAGSILFFPAHELHTANKVVSGTKYFIFLYIQSEYGFSHSLYENFRGIVQDMKRIRPIP